MSTDAQWQQDMNHAKTIPQPPELAWRALQETRVVDIPVARFLLAVREIPSRIARKPGVENTVTLIELADSENFTVVGSHEPTLLQLANVAKFWQPVAKPGPKMADYDELIAFNEPGWAKVLMYFSFEPDGTGTKITTGTKVAATDKASKRKFAAYWTLIRPFAGWIRVAMLNAIAKRAEELSTQKA